MIKNNILMLIDLIRGQGLKYFFMIVFSLITVIFFEIVSLAQVYPFIQLLTDGVRPVEGVLVKTINTQFGDITHTEFVRISAIILLCTVILKGLSTWVFTLYNTRYSFKLAEYTHLKMIERFHNVTYSQYKKIQFSNFLKFHVKELPTLAIIVSSTLLLVTEIFVFLAILIFIFTISPDVTLIALTMIGTIFLGNRYLISPKVVSLGVEREKSELLVVESLKRMFQGFIAHKFTNSTNVKTQRYPLLYSRYTDINILNILYQSASRILIESFGYGLVALIPLVIILTGRFDTFEFASFGIVMVSFLRLLPSINRITSSINVLAFSLPSLDLLRQYYFLETAQKYSEDINDFKTIDVDQLSIHYGQHKLITDLTFQIRKGDKIVISGPSGCGKTSLLERLIGLIPPDAGSVKINNSLKVDSENTDWSKRIAYLGQNSYVFNSSIRDNVVVGREFDATAYRKIIDICHLAQISMSDENSTASVGEDGNRLSGGQKQRVNLARVLYENPEIIILDEPTSAIDNETALSILKRIKSEFNDKTIIIIDHRKHFMPIATLTINFSLNEVQILRKE